MFTPKIIKMRRVVVQVEKTFMESEMGRTSFFATIAQVAREAGPFEASTCVAEVESPPEDRFITIIFKFGGCGTFPNHTVDSLLDMILQSVFRN